MIAVWVFRSYPACKLYTHKFTLARLPSSFTHLGTHLQRSIRHCDVYGHQSYNMTALLERENFCDPSASNAHADTNSHTMQRTEDTVALPRFARLSALSVTRTHLAQQCQPARTDTERASAIWKRIASG
eukprot:IDg18491t1